MVQMAQISESLDITGFAMWHVFFCYGTGFVTVPSNP